MILVFDVGATRTRVGLSADGYTLKKVSVFETDRSKVGFEKLLHELQQFVGVSSVSVISGGFPGQMDVRKGTLTRVTNMPQWNGCRVARELRNLWAAELFLANDAALGGLGEAHSGAGINRGVMVYVTVSSGVNMVRVVDGRIDMSIRSFDLGQQLVAREDGKITTLEKLIGGVALEARARRPPKDIHEPRVWRREATYLAQGLYNTLLHWTPDVVVFGGSMMRDIDLAQIEAELDTLPQTPLGRRPRLIRARLKDLAGLHGALALARTARS